MTTGFAYTIYREGQPLMRTAQTRRGTLTIRCLPTKEFDPFVSGRMYVLGGGPWFVSVSGPGVVELGFGDPEQFTSHDAALSRVRAIERALRDDLVEPTL